MHKQKKYIVIGFVGKRGCGKDICTKYLTKKYKAKEIIFSDFIGESLNFFHISPSRRNIAWFITSVRRRFGKGVLARAVIAEIQEDGYSVYLLNGIRLKREVEIIREKFKKQFLLVDLACNDRVRFQRIKKREKKTKIMKDEVSLSLKKFLKQERNIITEKEIESIEEKADYVIENNGTRRELFKKLDELILKKSKIPNPKSKRLPAMYHNGSGPTDKQEIQSPKS